MEKEVKTKIHLIAYCQGTFQAERVRNYVLKRGVKILNSDFYEMGRNQTISLGDSNLVNSLQASDEAWVVQGQTSGGPGVYLGVYKVHDHFEADGRLCSLYKQYLAARKAKVPVRFFRFSHYGLSQGTANERPINIIFPDEFSLFMKWWHLSLGGFARRRK